MPSFVLGKIGIPLTAIRKGETEFSFAVSDSNELEYKRSYVDSMNIQANVTLLGEDVLVKLAIDADTSLYCDRCGEKFHHKIHGDITTLFTSDPQNMEGADGGEVRLFDNHASELEITQEIVDALILSVPSKIICNEKCKGLCSQCGVNFNEKSCTCSHDSTDPRWDALKKLKLNQ
ncbi:DUF177 domain-containing protein [bacterium]